MSAHPLYPVPAAFAAQANITADGYQALHQQALDDPEGFWAAQAQRFIQWQQPWQQVMAVDYRQGQIVWFQGATLNVTVNCLDRHLPQRGDQTALIWEGDEPNSSRQLSYRQLHQQVCQAANVLKSLGVDKGDRVCIYLPMIIEAAVVILACARIGAVHSIVFGGFSAEALRDRIQDADCRLVICADDNSRGGKRIPSKSTVDQALNTCPSVETVLVIRHSGNEVAWTEGRDIDYHHAMAQASSDCPPTWMAAEDPLFILYTSGSTGKPKGLLHTTGGYLLYAAMTHYYVFDHHDGDVYWCTADIGWITGHSYVLYGPLCNGATTVLFEGTPTYPQPDRFWQVIDKHQVNVFYTAPTAIRALMAQGDHWLNSSSRQSLRLLGTVGEPINPEAWEWYYRIVGECHCPIVDTWWQTETGGILITPLPGATALKPGSATLPFMGIQPAIVDNNGTLLDGEAEGYLVMTASWPGQARSIYGNHIRFIDTYFSRFPGYYFAGDGARRDADGYYWITGRVDDVINVAGHRLGTAEIESALVLHHAVAEAAVVGYPHAIKGQGIYAFVTLKQGISGSNALQQQLIALVRQEIGAIASPDQLQWAPGLPKTRSGKIMRRILRLIAANQLADLGDTSTLADPAVVDELVAHRFQLS